MKTNSKIIIIGVFLISVFSACGIPKVETREEKKSLPQSYLGISDTNSIASINWKEFFNDSYLSALIDTALKNNQEFNMLIQEINIMNNEVSAKKGEYLPYVNLETGAGIEKVGRFTRNGAVEKNIEIDPGKENPEPLPNFNIQFVSSWEIDIWRKLRNSRDASIQRYLSSIEGKNFMQTKLIAEIAICYYELLALDNQLAITFEYIQIQKNALKSVKLQKTAGEETELAVKKFEAEVLNTESTQFDIQQAITETENKINFLLGRFPQKIQRDTVTFENPLPSNLSLGVPAQLLEKRPDIRQATYELSACKLDVKVAKAMFYPSLDIKAGIGLEAFNPAFLLQSPESILYSLGGDLVAPLINRKAIKAAYNNANSKQMIAVFNYEQTILNAYIEVYNQVSKMDNLKKTYDLKLKEVNVLNECVNIANELFMSARADYMEVLMTQRDALVSKLELNEYKKYQFINLIHLYQALGGGWE